MTIKHLGDYLSSYAVNYYYFYARTHWRARGRPLTTWIHQIRRDTGLMLSSWLATHRFGGKSQRRDATADRFAPWWWWWWPIGWTTPLRGLVWNYKTFWGQRRVEQNGGGSSTVRSTLGSRKTENKTRHPLLSYQHCIFIDYPWYHPIFIEHTAVAFAKGVNRSEMCGF